MTAAKRTTDNVCPYLGMKNDTNSHMAFPSPINYCNRCLPAARVSLHQQEAACLDAENYLKCDVYGNGQGKPLPISLRNTDTTRRSSRSKPSPYILVFVVGMVLFGLILWVVDLTSVRVPLASTITPTLTQPVDQIVAETVNAISAIQTSQAELSQTPTLLSDALTPSLTPTVTLFPTLTLTPTVTNTITFTPSITSTPTITYTPSITFTPSNTPTATPTQTITNTPTSTNTSTPTRTATVTPSHTPTQTFTPSATAIPPFSLDVPIGGQKKFVVHRVVTGENLNAIAERFGSTVDTIVAVNYSLPSPILEGTVVVVPFQINLPVGLPVLEPYQVVNAQISIEDIAALVKADPAQLKLYNNCTTGQIFTQGNWILIPRAVKATPAP